MKSLLILLTSAVALPGFLALNRPTAQPDLKNGERISKAVCQRCHGVQGNPQRPRTPRIAAQHEEYFLAQWHNYKTRARQHKRMNALADSLSEQDVKDLAAYFNRQKQDKAWESKQADRFAAGEKLFTRGDASRNLIACAVCHGPDGTGVGRLEIANIRWQSPEYFQHVMKDFRKLPSDLPAVPLSMKIVASALTDEEIMALSEYVGALPDAAAARH